MRIYVCGPMTGHAQFNLPTFDAATADLRERGHDVVSPAELDDPETRKVALASPDGAPGSGSSNGETWGDFLARDVKLLADDGIEAIAVLPGWEKSKGARLETFVGRLCGLSILRYPDLEPVSGTHINEAHAADSMADLARRMRENRAEKVSRPDGEVRVVDPVTGGAKGMKLAQLGALDPAALMVVAEVAGFGGAKYARYNFLNGFDWSLAYDALQRHMHAFWGGEEIDPESGLPHPAHAAWQALCLTAFWLRGLGTDDRPPATELRGYPGPSA